MIFSRGHAPPVGRLRIALLALYRHPPGAEGQACLPVHRVTMGLPSQSAIAGPGS